MTRFQSTAKFMYNYGQFLRFSACAKNSAPRFAVHSMKLKFVLLTFFTLTTVFLDTRLFKSKHPLKRFQNFRQFPSIHVIPYMKVLIPPRATERWRIRQIASNSPVSTMKCSKIDPSNYQIWKKHKYGIAQT